MCIRRLSLCKALQGIYSVPLIFGLDNQSIEALPVSNYNTGLRPVRTNPSELPVLGFAYFYRQVYLCWVSSFCMYTCSLDSIITFPGGYNRNTAFYIAERLNTRLSGNASNFPPHQPIHFFMESQNIDSCFTSFKRINCSALNQ